MSETEQAPGEIQAAKPAEPAPSIDPREVEEGKAFAILSYALSIIGLPFFLVPLIMRNNAFALFHAKQCLMLWLAGIVLFMLSGLLVMLCIGVVLLPLAGIAVLVLCILGLVNASKGQMTVLPVIGKLGEDWFKGIQKA